ncbi:hypothetical protein Ciccas_008913 [Cichlidogyrus casuarinus]|uniref:Uncharacterized protein n=1 Tax=Cichlidogyrus casuarinus TaxID=1844966 RepID=A0ABD2Q072_9PLAT
MSEHEQQEQTPGQDVNAESIIDERRQESPLSQDVNTESIIDEKSEEPTLSRDVDTESIIDERREEPTSIQDVNTESMIDERGEEPPIYETPEPANLPVHTFEMASPLPMTAGKTYELENETKVTTFSWDKQNEVSISETQPDENESKVNTESLVTLVPNDHEEVPSLASNQPEETSAGLNTENVLNRVIDELERTPTFLCAESDEIKARAYTSSIFDFVTKTMLDKDFKLALVVDQFNQSLIDCHEVLTKQFAIPELEQQFFDHFPIEELDQLLCAIKRQENNFDQFPQLKKNLNLLLELFHNFVLKHTLNIPGATDRKEFYTRADDEVFCVLEAPWNCIAEQDLFIEQISAVAPWDGYQTLPSDIWIVHEPVVITSAQFDPDNPLIQTEQPWKISFHLQLPEPEMYPVVFYSQLKDSSPINWTLLPTTKLVKTVMASLKDLSQKMAFVIAQRPRWKTQELTQEGGWLTTNWGVSLFVPPLALRIRLPITVKEMYKPSIEEFTSLVGSKEQMKSLVAMSHFVKISSVKKQVRLPLMLSIPLKIKNEKPIAYKSSQVEALTMEPFQGTVHLQHKIRSWFY